MVIVSLPICRLLGTERAEALQESAPGPPQSRHYVLAFGIALLRPVQTDDFWLSLCRDDAGKARAASIRATVNKASITRQLVCGRVVNTAVLSLSKHVAQHYTSASS
jgi:hypothetical protein